MAILGMAVSGSLVQAESEKVTVTGITGSPQVIRQGQSMPATAGMACQKEDILKTTAGCSMDIAINQMAGCRILPSTECMLSGTDKKSMDLKVADGNVILNLKKLPKNSTFKVETPTAVATVRGTQFWGRVDMQKAENPVTTFAVRQGAVEILEKSTGKNFTIKKGQALDIPKDTAVESTVREALPEEMGAMEQASSIKTAGEKSK